MPYKNPHDAARRDKQYRAEQRAESTGIGMPVARLPKVLRIKSPAHGLRIAVIPDVQAKPGVLTNHLAAAGRYIAAHKPDVIVCIGDFADMPSLSSYDVGTRQFEGRRYIADLAAAHDAMDELMHQIYCGMQDDGPGGWDPALVMLYGNHEDRITRAVNQDPKLEGMMQLSDLRYETWGWKCFPFLQPVVIGGVAFCHYFPSGVMGRPITTPRAILSKLHMSAYAGHQQGRDIAFSRRADGKELTAIISGSFYQHDEEYLSPFTNKHWRGMHILNEVKDGSFDAMELSLNYLLRKWS